MDRGRTKTDGLSFLTSLIINVIVFSLAFVYLAGGQPPEATGIEPEPVGPIVVEPEPTGPIIVEPESAGPIEMNESIGATIELLEISPPADFIDETGTGAGMVGDAEDYESPRFKQIFDSYQLRSPYRGNEYIVTIKLEIDSLGHLVGEPTVVVSSGQKDVDTETIRRLKRIRFTPARNSTTGEPIAAVMTTKIFWIPGGG